MVQGFVSLFPFYWRYCGPKWPFWGFFHKCQVFSSKCTFPSVLGTQERM